MYAGRNLTKIFEEFLRICRDSNPPKGWQFLPAYIPTYIRTQYIRTQYIRTQYIRTQYSP